MRIALACLLSAAALLQGCGPKTQTGAPPPGHTAQGPLAPAAPPRPEPGLWQNAMTMTGPRAMTISTKICLDAAMISGDGWMKPPGGSSAAQHCTQAYAGAVGGYSFQSTCKFGDKTIVSQGVAKGDFHSGYAVDITSHMDPPEPGMPADTQMSIVATRLGPCPDGMAGGPVPGSMTMTPAKG